MEKTHKSLRMVFEKKMKNFKCKFIKQILFKGSINVRFARIFLGGFLVKALENLLKRLLFCL